MKNAFKTRKPFLVAGLFMLVTLASAWQFKDKKQDSTANHNNYRSGDTTNPKQPSADKDEFRINGLDEGLKDLDIQMKDLDVQLKDLDINIEKQVYDAVANIDFDKISKEVEENLQKIDWDKIQADVDKSIKDAQVQLKNIDMKKITDEVKEMQEKFNSKEFQDQFNSEKINQQINNAMKQAREGIDKAKQQVQQLKDFTEALQKDGLIDKSKGYTIEWKDNGDLYINGEKQSKQVSDKYSPYYKPGGYTIKNGPEN